MHHVVHRVAGARAQLVLQRIPVVQRPVLVGILEHEVPRPRQLLHQFMRIAQPGVDEAVQPRLAEVAQRLGVAAGVDFDGGHVPARLAGGPGQPQRAVPGRGADVQDAAVAALHHQVVHHPRAALGHVPQVHAPPPLAALAVQEGLHARVQRRAGRGCGVSRPGGQRQRGSGGGQEQAAMGLHGVGSGRLGHGDEHTPPPSRHVGAEVPAAGHREAAMPPSRPRLPPQRLRAKSASRRHLAGAGSYIY